MNKEVSILATLAQAVNSFNRGCRLFRSALNALIERNIALYENELNGAQREVIGSLEWMVRLYLKTCSLSAEDRRALARPNFNLLMDLMKKYADPPLDEQQISSLFEYREQRNNAEHSGGIPSCISLYASIEHVRTIALTYLQIPAADLEVLDSPQCLLQDFETKRHAYLSTLSAQTEFMDLGGISPKVGNRLVKIRMRDLFVNLELVEEAQLFESLDSENPESTSAIQLLGHGRSSLQELLKNPKVVVLGHPGAGKTTIGKFIAYTLAQGRSDELGLNKLLPVLLRVSDYAAALSQNNSHALFEFIRTSLYSGQYADLLSSYISLGQCLVIVDGLDEISSPELRSLTTRRIEQFINDFGQNRFVLTSRIVGYRQNPLFGELVHATLSDLNDEQILEFLRKWHLAVEQETENEVDNTQIEKNVMGLWQSIKSKAGISKLASNPLLLTIIALANWRGTKLPDKRVQLYEIATETLIENWPLKQRALHLNAEEILAILEPVAFHIYCSGKENTIVDQDLRPLFESQVSEVRRVSAAEARNASRDLLEIIEFETGFFLVKGTNIDQRKVYGFLHPTFAEYLAARHLAEQWSEEQSYISPYLHQSRWHEVILLMAGHVSTWGINLATKLIDQIRTNCSPFEDLLCRDLFLAAEMVADNVRVKRDLQDELVDSLLQKVLEGDEDLLRPSLRALGKIAQLFPMSSVADRLAIDASDPAELRLRKSVALAMTQNDLSELVKHMSQTRIANGTLIDEIGEILSGQVVPMFGESHSNLLILRTVNSGMMRMLTDDAANRLIGAGAKPIGLEELLHRGGNGTDDKGLYLYRLKETTGVTAEATAQALVSGNAESDWIVWQIATVSGQAEALRGALLSIICDQEKSVGDRATAVERLGTSWYWYRDEPDAQQIAEKLTVLYSAQLDIQIRIPMARIAALMAHHRAGLSLCKQVVSDPDTAVKQAFLRRLRRQAYEEFDRELLRPLLADKDSYVRTSALSMALVYDYISIEQLNQEIHSLKLEDHFWPQEGETQAAIVEMLASAISAAEKYGDQELTERLGHFLCRLISNEQLSEGSLHELRALRWQRPKLHPISNEICAEIVQSLRGASEEFRVAGILLVRLLQRKDFDMKLVFETLQTVSDSVALTILSVLRPGDLAELVIQNILLAWLDESSEAVANRTAATIVQSRDNPFKLKAIDSAEKMLTEMDKQSRGKELLRQLYRDEANDFELVY